MQHRFPFVIVVTHCVILMMFGLSVGRVDGQFVEPCGVTKETFAGSYDCSEGYEGPKRWVSMGEVDDVTMDQNTKDIYYPDYSHGTISKISSLSNNVTTVITSNYSWNGPYRITFSPETSIKNAALYVIDYSNEELVEMDVGSGVAAYLAGAGSESVGLAANINYLYEGQMVVNKHNSQLTIANYAWAVLHQYDPATGNFTILCGGHNNYGTVDGSCTDGTALFSSIMAVAYNYQQQSFYVGDADDCSISIVVPGGNKTTIVGGCYPDSYPIPGLLADARLGDIYAFSWDAIRQRLYITDDNIVWKMTSTRVDIHFGWPDYDDLWNGTSNCDYTEGGISIASMGSGAYPGMDMDNETGDLFVANWYTIAKLNACPWTGQEPCAPVLERFIGHPCAEGVEEGNRQTVYLNEENYHNSVDQATGDVYLTTGASFNSPTEKLYGRLLKYSKETDNVTIIYTGNITSGSINLEWGDPSQVAFCPVSQKVYVLVATELFSNAWGSWYGNDKVLVTVDPATGDATYIAGQGDQGEGAAANISSFTDGQMTVNKNTGALVIANYNWGVLHQYTPSTGLFSILCGAFDTFGTVDGICLNGARFDSLMAFAIDYGNDVIYAGDNSDCSVSTVVVGGNKTMVAGGFCDAYLYSVGPLDVATFNSIVSFALDEVRGTLYVSDSDGYRVYKLRHDFIDIYFGWPNGNDFGHRDEDDCYWYSSGDRTYGSLDYNNGMDLDATTGDLYVSDYDTIAKITQCAIPTPAPNPQPMTPSAASGAMIPLATVFMMTMLVFL